MLPQIMSEQEIVFIEPNSGDVELLKQAFLEINFSPLLKVFLSPANGLRYLQVRYNEGSIPPAFIDP